MHKRVMVIAENKYGLPIIDFVRVHDDYTGPDTYHLGRIATLKELRVAFDRYCDAV